MSTMFERHFKEFDETMSLIALTKYCVGRFKKLNSLDRNMLFDTIYCKQTALRMLEQHLEDKTIEENLQLIVSSIGVLLKSLPEEEIVKINDREPNLKVLRKLNMLKYNNKNGYEHLVSIDIKNKGQTKDINVRDVSHNSRLAMALAMYNNTRIYIDFRINLGPHREFKRTRHTLYLRDTKTQPYEEAVHLKEEVMQILNDMPTVKVPGKDTIEFITNLVGLEILYQENMEYIRDYVTDLLFTVPLCLQYV